MVECCDFSSKSPGTTARSSMRKAVLLRVQDVSYSVQQKNVDKPILKNVSCLVKSGEMLCILGPSGCGKSSLIEVISGSVSNRSGKGRSVSGSVLCNEQQLTTSEFQNIAGLVPQDDLFNAMLTVRETLNFAARLRVPPAERKSCVDKTIALLQLESCENTRVGDNTRPDLRGISGGEKRRLSIAIELLRSSTSLLLLDEPTSGLDAASAQVVVNSLQELAQSGLSVIATLHQPRASILKQFDKFMMLAQGQAIYYGRISEYMSYLRSDLQLRSAQDQQLDDASSAHLLSGFADQLLDAVNPASDELGGSNCFGVLDSVSATDFVKILSETYAKSELCKTTAEEAQNEAEALKVSEPSGLLQHEYRVGWFGQFFTILRRTFIIKSRDPMVTATQMGYAIFIGFLFGLIYWQVYDGETQWQTYDAATAIGWTIGMSSFMTFDLVMTFPNERHIFVRERTARLYSSSAYFLGKTIAEMPSQIAGGASIALVTYFMVGLHMNLGTWIVLNIVAVQVGASLLMVFGAVCKALEEAMMLGMIILMIGIVLNPAFVRQVPDFLSWMSDSSYSRVLVELALYYEFKRPGIDHDTVFKNFSVHIDSQNEIYRQVGILFIIIGICRPLSFLAVKFMHNGQSFKDNLWM